MQDPPPPRYLEIERALRARIAALRPHHPIPSEPELCAEFGVSRMTARAAVERLLTDHLVYRVRGRGTFVAEPQAHRRVDNLTTFTVDMRRRGRTPASRLLRAGVRAATESESGALALPRDAEVVEVVRVRLADQRPIALERAVLPGSLRGVLDADLETGSLHEALRVHGRVPTRGVCVIRAENASHEDAAALEVEQGLALLVEERVVHDHEDAPLEFTTSRYSGREYALDAAFDVAGATPHAVPRRG